MNIKKVFAVAGIIAIAGGMVAFPSGNAQALSLNASERAASKAEIKIEKEENKSLWKSIKSLFSPRAESAIRTEAKNGDDDDGDDDSDSTNRAMRVTDRKCTSPVLQWAITFLFNSDIIDANLKADLDAKVAGRTCPTPTPVPTPERSVQVTGYLEDAGPSVTMWGTHTLRVTHVAKIQPAVATSLSMYNRVVRVQAANNTVLNELNAYENSYVRISGTAKYYDIEGGFWGILVQDISQIQTNPADGDIFPIINGLTGPAKLKINETGTWKITAHDDGTILTYAVLWGDIAAAAPSTEKMNQQYSAQTTTFTHAYAAAGTYTVTFNITDNAGHTTTTTITVEVVAQ